MSESDDDDDDDYEEEAEEEFRFNIASVHEGHLHQNDILTLVLKWLKGCHIIKSETT